MSDKNIFNQNSNLVVSNNERDIQMKDPNANQQNFNAMVGFERKVLKFNLDPGILNTNLQNFINENFLLKNSKSNVMENVVIKQIINKVDELSKNLAMIINDFQGKLQELEDKNFSYAVNNNSKVDSNENNIQNLQSGMSKVNELINESIGRIKILEDFKSNLEAKLNDIINEIKEKQNANDTTIKKVEKIEQVLQNNNIKIEDIKIENKKEFKDIEIKNYEKNSNEKELKFKIFQKNNIIYFNDITKDCGEKGDKEKELVDKCKIIFKKDKDTEKNIVYEISTKCNDWEFSRQMKNIMKRIYRARFYKRVNFRNLDHVFRMKWSEKQIQFEKIKATPRYINNNNFFVKVKNAMIFVINKGKFKKNLNRFNKFKFYNNYFNNQNLLGKFNKNFNNNQNVNRNMNNQNNNYNNNNRKNNNKSFNNKKRFKNNKRFNNNKRYMYRNNYNRNRYYNNNPKYGFIKRVILVPKFNGFNQRGQNFRL